MNKEEGIIVQQIVAKLNCQRGNLLDKLSNFDSNNNWYKPFGENKSTFELNDINVSFVVFVTSTPNIVANTAVINNQIIVNKSQVPTPKVTAEPMSLAKHETSNCIDAYQNKSNDVAKTNKLNSKKLGHSFICLKISIIEIKENIIVGIIIVNQRPNNCDSPNIVLLIG